MKRTQNSSLLRNERARGKPKESQRERKRFKINNNNLDCMYFSFFIWAVVCVVLCCTARVLKLFSFHLPIEFKPKHSSRTDWTTKKHQCAKGIHLVEFVADCVYVQITRHNVEHISLCVDKRTTALNELRIEHVAWHETICFAIIFFRCRIHPLSLARLTVSIHKSQVSKSPSL